MDIQTQVYSYFTYGTGKGSLNTAILKWQADLGYISPSITMNWMAIAQDNGIQYIGDIDMQNGFAQGRYQLDSTGLTITPGASGTTLGYSNYEPLGIFGSIEGDLGGGMTLVVWIESESSFARTQIFLSGPLTATDLASVPMIINGVTYPPFEWIEVDVIPGISVGIAFGTNDPADPGPLFRQGLPAVVRFDL